MSSSLQRALNAEKSCVDKKNVGAFEACFAGGLDLSEFDSNNHSADPHTKGPTTSHAAALLAVRKKEAAQKAIQDKEEVHMQEIVSQRVQKLQSKKKEDFLVGALASMHGGDRCVLEMKGRKLKKPRISKGLESRNKGGKKRVAKKFQRAKY